MKLLPFFTRTCRIRGILTRKLSWLSMKPGYLGRSSLYHGPANTLGINVSLIHE